jgi:hypothetical protein
MNMSSPVTSAAVRPFTRLITTPPAFPWDQQRAAMLEARHTSPVAGAMKGAMSGDGPQIVVRRLSPWKSNEGGRFVAIYFKPGDALNEEVEVEVQGKLIKIDLNAKARLLDQMRQSSWLVGCVAVIIVCLGLQLGLTLQRRADADDQITQAESRFKHNALDLKTLARAKADAQALTELDLKSQSVSQVIHDLKTINATKQPQALIDSFLWDRGYWAVEARGPDVPLLVTGAPLKRSVKPVRQGVWLWLATPESKAEHGTEVKR